MVWIDDEVWEEDMNKLVQGKDGLWYIIPAMMKKQFEEWVASEKPVPGWIEKVDGPHVVEFSTWRIA